MHLRKSFHKRLADLSKSHPEIMKFQKKLSPSHLGLRSKICDQIRTSFPCHHLRHLSCYCIWSFPTPGHIFCRLHALCAYIRCLFVAPCLLVMWPSFDVILADLVSVVIPLLELKKATKDGWGCRGSEGLSTESVRDGSNISSYIFHQNQLFPWPQSGVFQQSKPCALRFNSQNPLKSSFNGLKATTSFNCELGKILLEPIVPHRPRGKRESTLNRITPSN